MDVCPGAEATLTASTSMDDENMVFTWYSDAELGNSIGTGATLQITGPEAQATYYVTVKGDNTCENLPGDAAEADVYAIAPIDNIRLEPVEERIGMGKETEKALTVEPTDAYYTAVWTANGQVIADPDSYFPAKPYDDVEYKVVVTDGTRTARTTTSLWGCRKTYIWRYSTDGATWCSAAMTDGARRKPRSSSPECTIT